MAPYCGKWPWSDPMLNQDQNKTGNRIVTLPAHRRTSFSINVDHRLSAVIDTIRTKIDQTVQSVEEDISNENVNNIVLALSNGLAGRI